MVLLKVLEGDYGLASMDPECLQLLLLAKVSKLSVDVSWNTWKFPALTDGEVELNNFPAIVKYMEAPVNLTLTYRQKCEAFVIISMMRYSLLPVVKYVYWLDQYNFDEFTSKWFQKSKSLLFNRIFLKQYRDNAHQLLTSRFPYAESNEFPQYLFPIFQECILYFAPRLRTYMFYFGNSPSIVDIALYGYLAPLLKVPFPNNIYGQYLREFNTIVYYVNRIHRAYFPEVLYTEKYIRPNIIPVSENDISSILVLAGCAVFMSVLGYAMLNGLVPL